MIDFRRLGIAALAALTLAGCAENWSYDVKSMHHEKDTGRYYVVCKSGFTETFITVDVTPEVYNLIKVDNTCPAPVDVPPTSNPVSTPTSPTSPAPTSP